MSWIAVGVGAAGVIGGAISRGKANKKLSNIQKRAEANRYVANPLAQKRLALANTLLNARMPGATQAERNIYGAGANAQANVQRNATSGSQALAVGSAIQGQQGQDFSNLSGMEMQDYQRRLANQENAQQGVINEGDKEQAGTQNLLGQQSQIQGAQSANNANTWSSVANLGFSGAQFGIQGGFNSGLGKSFWGRNNAGNRTSPYNQQIYPYGN